MTRSPFRHFGRRLPLFPFLAVLIVFAFGPDGSAAERPLIRLGLLQVGTVNWEVAAMRDGLARDHGIEIDTLTLADKDAAAIALMSGQVDMIVTDWLWVARQRAAGKDFTFVPFSLAAGGVLARPDSGITDVNGLVGRRLGVGGGPDDKAWLLLRAYARKAANIDLAKQADIAFSAPPLLNALIERGELDAILNFWQFNAQLMAKGYREIIPVQDMLTALGIATRPPLLGWVFHEKWAARHPAAMQAFLDTSFAAKQHLLQDEMIWQKLRPLMQAGDNKLFETLKAAYRAGIPSGYGKGDIEAAQQVLAVMQAVDPATTAGLSTLPNGTFWAGYRK